MSDSTFDRLLIGTAGWQRPAWADAFYPEDLPPDWRLAYYANVCDALLVGQADLADCRVEDFDRLLDEAGDDLWLFVDGTGLAPAWREWLAGLPRARVVPLGVTGQASAVGSGGAPWSAEGHDDWVDPGSGRRLRRWPLEVFDLRALREPARALAPEVAVLIVDGPAGSPAHVGELRTLLGLLGRA
jgi:hypothetical protein